MKILPKPEPFIRTRLLRGLTQRELARRTGLSPGYISQLEKGDKTIGPAAAKKLCELLETEFESIFKLE